MSWRFHGEGRGALAGQQLYAKGRDGTMRLLCEVGPDCVFGGLVAEERGEGFRVSSHVFVLDDDEQAVVVSPLARKPRDRVADDCDEPDYAGQNDDMIEARANRAQRWLP